MTSDRIAATAVLANQIGELKATVEQGFSRIEARFVELEHRVRGMEDWRTESLARERTAEEMVKEMREDERFTMSRSQFRLALFAAFLGGSLALSDFIIRLVTGG